MGRYYFDKKEEADSLKKVQIWFLKQHGYFEGGWKSGTITWTSQWGDKGSISIQVNIFGESNYTRLTYTQTDRETGDKKDFDQKYPLVTTPCYFGGKRYWFICPMYKSGVYCGRRVGVLYKSGDLFACRHCYSLSYSSKNLGGLFKSIGQVISMPDLEAERLRIKRKTYAGKRTKRYERYLKKERKAYLQIRVVSRGLGVEI